MSNSLGALSEADICQLMSLIESLEHSTFDFLQLEIGDLKVTIGKGDGPFPADVPASGNATRPGATPPQAAAVVSQMPATAAPAPRQATSAAVPPDGTSEVTAPFLGIFYAQSEPGAPPFVTVGSQVDEGTTVALIEVMKTFNAVPAGKRGMIAEVCVQNAQMVEFAQVLFRILPA